MKTLSIVAITAFAFLGLADFASAQFQVSSDTFMDNGLLPLRVIDDSPVLTTEQRTYGNECASKPGDRGENQSPALKWTNIPLYTQTFVVTAFDTTAQVYHWGMYNIFRSTTALPENAGVAESTFGLQVRNYSNRLGYKGPCPPANDTRGDPHNYVFTVYALKRSLTQRDLPLNSDAEALQRVVTAVGPLATASITGLWSSTPPKTPSTQ
jgi:Raf kinase inhibitor-like YbhB/YbcL family protein